jgi:hypothetical protein
MHEAKRGWDGVRFLAVYCALLYLIPAALIFRPIGAAGTPAALWAMVGLLIWLCGRAAHLVPSARNPVAGAMGAFIAAVVASYGWGMTTGWYSPAGIQGATDDLYDLIPATPGQLREAMISAADRGLLAVAAWSGVVVMVLASLRTWMSIQLFLRVLVLIGTVIACIGIIQFLTGLDIAAYIHIPGLAANTEFGAPLERSVLRRVQATAIHPIEYGVVMAALFPLALHRAIFSAGRLSAWLQAVAIGLAAMLSVSRSAVLVMAVALFVMFSGWSRRWRVRASIAFPIAVVGLRLLVPGLVGTIVSMWRNLFADTSTTGRTSDYGVLLNLFQGSPILGRGHFTFVPRYYRIVDNQLLVSLVELGTVGFAALVLLFACAWFAARGARRRSPSPEFRHLGLALSGSIAGIFVSFVTFDAFGYAMASGTAFLLIGVAGAVWQVSRDEQVSSQKGVNCHVDAAEPAKEEEVIHE